MIRARIKKPILVFTVIVVVLISGLGIKQLLEPLFYPLYYLQEVVKAAEEFSLDPFLILSIIKEESGFDNYARSPAGAEGLMQLMPDTAEWIIGEMGLDVTREEAVWDAESNIRMGAWYLDWLINTYYEGNTTVALVAYNAGIRLVDDWLDQGIWDGSAEDFDAIPYSETKEYIKDVLRNYSKYHRIYDIDFESKDNGL